MAHPLPHPFWKSWGLNACNSWPWANKRLSCLLAKKKKESDPGSSRVVQWLGLCAPNTGGPGLMPGQGTQSHMLPLVCMPQLKTS